MHDERQTSEFNHDFDEVSQVTSTLRGPRLGLEEFDLRSLYQVRKREIMIQLCGIIGYNHGSSCLRWRRVAPVLLTSHTRCSEDTRLQRCSVNSHLERMAGHYPRERVGTAGHVYGPSHGTI